MLVFLFLSFFLPINVVTFFCDFVTELLSRHIPLVPLRSCILSCFSFCDLFTHNKPPICVVSCPPQPPPRPSTRVTSPPIPRENLPFLCVSSYIYSYSFDHFLCVSPCLLTLLHPSATVHTHSHLSVPFIVPPCIPYPPPCNMSLSTPLPSPCMSSRDHPCPPMSSSCVRSCHYTPLHPSSPNHTHL